MEGKKLAILGATYHQEPLIIKARELGVETHVFAWEQGSTAKQKADFFYPISIVCKEEILIKCQSIGIDGITSVASDVAVETVNYIAERMGLIGNSIDCTIRCRDKFEMRKALSYVGLNSIKYQILDSLETPCELQFPFMVKAVDRSGSRGISLVTNKNEFEEAYKEAYDVSFSNKVLIEEYFEGRQFSFEVISEKGIHNLVAVTAEHYSGPPNFVEIGHYIPAALNENQLSTMKYSVFKALTAVDFRNGASHTEIRLGANGETQIIEIGARMGGDFRDLMVLHSTNYDFLESIIRNSLNVNIKVPNYIQKNTKVALVRYCTKKNDYEVIKQIKKQFRIIQTDVEYGAADFTAKSSDERKGYVLAEGELDLEVMKHIFTN